MTTLRLDAENNDVFDLTMRAVQSTEGIAPTTTLRCRSGHCILGHTGDTPFGPLMTSSWDVETAPNFRVNVNGQDLSRSAILKYRDAKMPLVSQSGAPVTHMDRHGTIALLALPLDLKQEFPDLLVRCKHGDAVLDRAEVLAWHRAGRASKVAVSKPFAEYAPQRQSTRHGKVGSREERRAQTGDAAGRTPEEVKGILRQQFGHDS